MKKNNKNDFLKKWAAFVVAVAIFFIGGFLSGASWGGKYALRHFMSNTSSLEEKAVPITEAYSAIGVVSEKGEDSFKVTYRMGNSDEEYVKTVAVDENTQIIFSEDLPNGDEKIEMAQLSDFADGSTIIFFSNDNILDKSEIIASKIKIIK